MSADGSAGVEISPRIVLGNAVKEGAPAAALDLQRLLAGRLLVQGSPGAGKSTLLRLILERIAGRIQALVIDPEGEFGQLSSLGYVHIEYGEARRVGPVALARHLRELRHSTVLDLSDAGQEQQMEFVAGLAATLVEQPAELWKPMVVAVDEAQLLAPHYASADLNNDSRRRSIAALADLMTRGRKRGLVGIIVTQRMAETAKTVTSKAENYLVGRTVFDRDLQRAGAALGYTQSRASGLRRLADGEFLGAGPALGPYVVRFRCALPQTASTARSIAIEPLPEISAAAARAAIAALPDDETPAPAEEVAEPKRRYWSTRPNAWTAAHDAMIRAGYEAGESVTEIGAKLGAAGLRRSGQAIAQRAHVLGLKHAKRIAGWSAEEDAILRAGYASGKKIIEISADLAAAGFDRKRVSVQMRAISLGITRDRVNYWREEELAIAKPMLERGERFSDIISALEAAGYHRGLTSIHKLAAKLNLARKQEEWSAEELRLLRENYPRLGPKGTAKLIGRSVASVTTRAYNLEIKYRAEWTAEERRTLMDAVGKRRLVDVAEQLGRKYHTVAAMAKRMGLDFGKGRPRKSMNGASADH